MRISDWSSDVCSSDLKSDAEQGRVRPLPVRAIAGIKYFGFIHALQRRRPVDSENDRPTGRANIRPAPPLYMLSRVRDRSEEHTSELQSLMRISYAVFCLKKKKLPKNISSIHKR